MELHIKRLLALVVALPLLLAACGGAKQAVPKTEPAPAVATTDSGSGPATAPAPPEAKAEPVGKTEPAAAEPKPAPTAPGSANLPKLWDFFATWCGPCRTQAPIIAGLETEYHGRIEITSIDVDENRELAQRFNVQAIPTLVFLDAAGNELDRHTGLMQKDEILAKFRSLGFIQ